jgi:hypothetical protein
MKTFFLFSILVVMISCSTVSSKNAAQRDPSSSLPEPMQVDIPMTADERSALWTQMSKMGGLVYYHSVDGLQPGVTYAYCSDGLGIDFTKVSLNPLNPGPIAFLDKAGNITGTGTLKNAKSWQKVSGDWWTTRLEFTDIKSDRLPSTITLIDSRSGGLGLDDEGGNIQNCRFFANQSFSDIVNAPSAPIIQYKILPTDGASKVGQQFTDTISMSNKKIRGLLDGRVIGDCKFSWYPPYDVLNVESANPGHGDDDYCELSPRAYLAFFKNYMSGRTLGFSNSCITLKFAGDGPHLYQGIYQLNSNGSVCSAIFLPDSSNPALGEAYRDVNGLIWGSPVRAPSGEIRAMLSTEALDYCRSIGARLPTNDDYVRLLPFDHNRHLYNLPNSKTELIPGIATVKAWTSTQFCPQKDRSGKCMASLKYDFFSPNPTGSYPYNPVKEDEEHKAVRCVMAADPFRADQ